MCRDLSNDDVDFSSVHVKVFSSSGFLKQDVECAANGYFFMPFYDVDTYTVKVEAEDGWTFQPPQHTLAPNADGTYNCDDDINFVVTGFRVTAHIAGATGVTMSLAPSREGRGEVVVQADADGTATFENVAPGAYRLAASHPVWTMDAAPRHVTVRGRNVDVEGAFTVLGYDVSGVVSNNGAPAAGVGVVVFTEDDVGSPACGAIPADVKLPRAAGTAICMATTDAAGRYTIKGVPAGHHTVVPLQVRTLFVWLLCPRSLCRSPVAAFVLRPA